jgi:hypothetical protein
VGPSPGRQAGYFLGDTILNRGAYDAALDIKGDLTLEALVYPTELPNGFKEIVGFSGATEVEADNTIYTMGVEAGGESCHVFYEHEHGAGVDDRFIWDTAEAGANAIAIPILQWSYLVVVRDDTAKTVTLFVNGYVHPVVYTYTDSPTGGGSSRVSVGGFWASDTRMWDGGIASVRISDVQRSAGDILELANRVLPSRAINMAVPASLPQVTPDTHPDVTLWHRADQNDTDDGDIVTTPTLLAGANGITQATAAEQPYLIPQHGQMAWRMTDGAAVAKWFDGAALSNYIASTPAFHVYCLFYIEDATLDDASPENNHRFLGDDAGNWGLYVRRTSGVTQVYGLLNDGSPQLVIQPHVSLRELHLAEWWYDSGAGEMVLRIDDGAEVRTSVGAITSVASALEVGGQDELVGAISEIVLADDLDTATQPGIRNYFRNEYMVDV